MNSESPQTILTGYSIVYFGNDWSGENRTSSHHIAIRAAALVPLLYVETPGLRAPAATGRDIRKLFRKLALALAPPRRIGDQFWLMTMPQIPFRQLPLVDLVNRLIGRLLVRRAIRQLGFGDIITWFVVPHPGELAHRLNESLVVYYCIDDYGALAGANSGIITGLDNDLTRAADVVFVAGPGLVEPKRRLNPVVEFSPHGVDVELFARAADDTTVQATETLSLRRPVIGYFGNVGEWIDLDLIGYLARSRPEWTFLLIGLLATDPGQLRSLPNVIFTGPKPYQSLPSWTKAFDAAIIPYRLTHHTPHANPLKLREYLASGKPVISVPNAEILRFADHVYLAETSEEFLNAVEQALAEDSDARRSARMAAVAGLTWDARFHEVIRIVGRELNRKHDRNPMH